MIHDPTKRPASQPHLLVDLQTAQGGFFGDRGIRRYAMSLTLALLRRDAVAAVLFNPNRSTTEFVPSELREGRYVEWSSTPALRRLDAEGATAYVMTSPFERVRPAASFLPQYASDSGMPVAAVLYDLIPEVIDVYRPDLMAGYRVRRELIRKLDLILAISEHTRRDAIERLDIHPDRVKVIGAGASDYFRVPVAGDQPALLLAERLPEITKPFALCVTGWSPHKNGEGLIDAWARLPRRTRDAHQLVITCRLPPEAGTTWMDRARELGYREDELVVTDYVDDQVLRALYQQSRLFVLPSFYEGFGLPVLEAVKCGAVAVASNASAVPEVLQWQPATFSPFELDEMAAVVERGLSDDEFRRQLRAAGEAAADLHTWERVADRAITACGELGGRHARREVPKKRLALVGSLADERARAPWNRLRHVLGPTADVDLFDASNAGDGYQIDHCRPLTAFGRTVDPWSYDAVVYLADSATPRAVLDAARRYPGVVWFLVAPSECPDGNDLSSAARARLVPPETTAPNGPAQLAPFARQTPIRATTIEDPGSAAGSLLGLLRAS